MLQQLEQKICAKKFQLHFRILQNELFDFQACHEKNLNIKKNILLIIKNSLKDEQKKLIEDNK